MQNQQIADRLSRVEQEVKTIKSILKTAPIYGSDYWWEQEIISGEKQINEGKFTTYKIASQLLSDLHKGK